IEHFLLLRQERIAQLLRDVEFLVHRRQHLRKRGQRLHARIPFLLLQSVFERLLLQPRIRLCPARGLDDLQRIGRRHQDLRDQRVGIKRDRRDQRLDLFLLERGGLCRRLLRRRLSVCERRERDRYRQCRDGNSVPQQPHVMSPVRRNQRCTRQQRREGVQLKKTAYAPGRCRLRRRVQV